MGCFPLVKLAESSLDKHTPERDSAIQSPRQNGRLQPSSTQQNMKWNWTVRMNMALRLCLALLIVEVPPAWADEFDSAGVKIHYLMQGQGEPVILVHGLMASAEINWVWPGVVAALAPNHRVVALDCRGHGLSGKPLGVDQYGTNMVEDVVRLMDHLKIQRADVAGYSMGGMITMKLMVLHPDRVRSGVVGGMGWLENDDLFPNLDKNDKDQNCLEDCAKGFNGLTLSPEQIRNIKTPFLVIIGDHDSLRQRFVEPLQRLRPDVPVKIIKDAGHLNCVGKPDFIKSLKTFLDSQTAKFAPN